MKLVIQIIKDTWEEYMMYRLSFVLWRVRSVMQLVVTYILLGAIVRPLVMGTRTQEVGGMIHDGSLSNYLIRPMHIFRFFFFRDIGDKTLNILFAVGEIALLLFFLRPPIFLQTNGLILLLTAVALAIGMMIFFYFSLLLSFLGFWSPDVWAPRFLSFVLAEFFTGMLFPLDILPAPLFLASKLLPFSYFIYFPLKVYLGQMDMPSVLTGLFVGFLWIGGMRYLASLLWHRGLRTYAAEGR